MKKIILASKSPRRKEILAMAGYPFTVESADCDEKTELTEPEEFVSDISARKALAIAKTTGDDCFIIGADTIVVFDGEIMGKPGSFDEAYRMLSLLNGKTHMVYTGVTVIDNYTGQTETFFEKTEVTFWKVSEQEIIEYINTGEPMDKAGSYGIQGIGSFLVKYINGDYYSVVGLPISHLIRVLKEMNKDEI